MAKALCSAWSQPAIGLSNRRQAAVWAGPTAARMDARPRRRPDRLRIGRVNPPRAYLDHAATTPTLPAAVDAMCAELARFGNPSSQHGSGREARRRLEEHRERIAGALGARPSEVLFTSGGTESDNLAVLGLFRGRRRADPARHRVVVSAIEHQAVLDVAHALARREGATVTWVRPDREGVVSAEAVRSAIEDEGRGPGDVALVACMWVNNEMGAVQPIEEIGAVAAGHGIPVHADAVQAVGKLPFDFAAAGVTTAAVSAHKFGGPTGVGLLLARRDAPLAAVSLGGGQERGIRSGTLAGGLIAGMSAALTTAVAERPQEAVRLGGLRDRILLGVEQIVPDVIVTGPWEPGDVTRRSPANAHVLIPECEGDSLLFLLDAAGVECSTGSACHAGVPQPSEVVLAMGYAEYLARGALRLSLGRTSTQGDVDAFLAALPYAVDRARRAHRASARAS